MRISIVSLARPVLIAAAVLLLLVTATGQDAVKPFRYNGSLYGQGQVGACAHGVFFGGGGVGGERLVWKGLSVGVAGSASAFVGGPSIRLLTGQIGYHFVDRFKTRGSDPFVSFGMGYGTSLSGRSSGSSNLGGGLNYWMNDHVGLRVEGRAVGISSDGIGVVQIGIAFR